MSNINLNYKIVFTGSVGAGKTTAISAISDSPPVITEAKIQGYSNTGKYSTTVAMDYGVIQLDGQQKVHLYGTPGQYRFRYMWDILTKGSLGLVMLLDNSIDNVLPELDLFIKHYLDELKASHVVIGITKMDLPGKYSLNTYNKILNRRGLSVPVLEVDARKKQDIALMIQILLLMIDPGLPDYQ